MNSSSSSSSESSSSYISSLSRRVSLALPRGPARLLYTRCVSLFDDPSQGANNGNSNNILSTGRRRRAMGYLCALAAGTVLILALRTTWANGAAQTPVDANVKTIKTAWEIKQAEEEAWEQECAKQATDAANAWLSENGGTGITDALVRSLITAEAEQSELATAAAERIGDGGEQQLENDGWVATKMYGATFTPSRALADADVAPCAWRCQLEDGSVEKCVRRNLADAARRERVRAMAILEGLSGENVTLEGMRDAILKESRANKDDVRAVISQAREATHEKRQYMRVFRAKRKEITAQNERLEEERRNCIWGCEKLRRRPTLARLRGAPS